MVDFGTATTFDVVDGDGAYLGGVIAPGINLSIEALHQAAARLPRIGIGRPQAVIGRSTVPAMQSGIYWGYVGLIEGLVDAHPGGIRRAAEGRRDRRPGAAVRRGHDDDRADRPRSDAGRAAPVGRAQPRAQLAARPRATDRKRLRTTKAIDGRDTGDLAFLPLGGTGEIGMNLNLYRCDGKWLAVDCGIGFGGADACPKST